MVRMKMVAGALALSFACASVGSAATSAPASTPAIVMENAPGLPGHTVYRPADPAKGGPLPVIAFGNGACRAVGNAYEPFLRAVAARGFLVVAGGEIDPAWRPGDKRPQTSPGHMKAALDWAIAENRRADSPLFGKVATGSLAVMGHSCGGLEAIVAGADPRVDTVLVLNSGIIRGGIPTPEGGVRQPSGYIPAHEADLPNLHTPTLYISGGPTDSAYSAVEEDFRQISHIPLVNASLPVGHSGTWRETDGGAMGAAAIAWLEWRLKGDAQAARMFEGADCGLCRDGRWTIKKKNMP